MERTFLQFDLQALWISDMINSTVLNNIMNGHKTIIKSPHFLFLKKLKHGLILSM